MDDRRAVGCGPDGGRWTIDDQTTHTGLPESYGRFDITGRVAVVTGASSGLGERFATVLAAAGARVVVAARRAGRVESLAARLGGEPAGMVAVPCDVTHDADVDRLFEETIDRFGRLDVLVNNAGTVGEGAADESPDEFRRVLDVNLTGLYACARLAGELMAARGGGVIVNIASISGLKATGGIDPPSYVASKAAVVHLTRELAMRWASSGVRVNALAPGYFPSEMTVADFETEEGLAYIRRHTPLGRPGRSDELDGPLLFLVSDAASYVTGHTLVVDGGWTA